MHLSTCTALVSLFKQQNKTGILKMTLFFYADMVTYLCCLTNRTSEPEPSKHTVLCMLTQCRVPECNERDILMSFHLFMQRKWRGTVTFWNGWQNKEPTLGEMIVFMISLWQMKVSRERQSDTFLTVQSVKWCDVWQHTRAWGASALICFHFRNERLRSADLGGSWKVTAVISANMVSAAYCTVYTLCLWI